MGVDTYVAMVGLSLVLGYAATKLDPVFVEHAARQFGRSRAKGWALFVAALLWLFLPALAGAPVGDGQLWVVGTALSGAGIYLATFAASSFDEHRLLQRATVRDASAVSIGTGDDVVATSGVPAVADSDHDGASTPFSGLPALHTDWFVQQRRRLGVRERWQNAASGVESTPFTLGNGRVSVEAGTHRVFADDPRTLTVDPDDDLLEDAAAFLRANDVFTDPENREKPIKLIEEYVPADAPVTVVGVPRQADEPGRVVIDDAPPDRVLGSHADNASSDGADAEVVVVGGDVETARARLRKRVRWLGAAGLAMTLGGQALAFWLAPVALG